MPGTGEKITVIACTRGRRRITCRYCSRTHEFLCDYPVAKRADGSWRTCSVPLCSVHTKKGVNLDFDFCRAHYGKARSAYERRKKRLLEVAATNNEKV